jgi:hypothetical protein
MCQSTISCCGTATSYKGKKVRERNSIFRLGSASVRQYMNSKYLPGSTYLLVTHVRHRSSEETYGLFVVALWTKSVKCALLDTWADKTAESGVKDCASIRFSGSHIRKLTPTSQQEQSSRHQSRQFQHWTQSSLNASDHPKQAANEDVTVDSTERFSFRLALIFLLQTYWFIFFSVGFQLFQLPLCQFFHSTYFQ